MLPVRFVVGIALEGSVMMFCKQCGKQIKPGTGQCPHCGGNAAALSGGTGFWNLTRSAKVEETVAPESPAPQAQSDSEGEQSEHCDAPPEDVPIPEKKPWTIRIIPWAIGTVLAALSGTILFIGRHVIFKA